MTKLRVLRSEIVTTENAKLRIVRAEIVTEVTASAKLRVLRSEIVTVPAPRLRILRSEIVTDVALVANAGGDQSVQSLDRVFLSALASSGDPAPTGFSWAQTAGPPVILHPDAASPTVSFTAPATAAGTICSFVVTASNGVDDPVSSVPSHVAVAPHSYWVGVAGQTLPILRYLSAPGGTP